MEIVPLAAVAKSPFAGVDAFCRWARERDIPLAVLSDYDPRRKLQALGLGQYFSVVVCAQDAEVGVFKPHPRGLELTLRRLGVEPAEALYVGDRAGVDDAVARAAGVPCFLLSAASGWPQLLRRMESEAA